MRVRVLFLSVGMALLLALPSTAGVPTFGPYPDFAGYLTFVGDLGTFLPDFDLSAFTGADPGSIVYVAGPGNMPLADVPVPASFALLTLGGLVACRRRCR